jgi:hypothetical protein
MDPIEDMAFSMAVFWSVEESKFATISVRQLMTRMVVSFCNVLNSSVNTEKREQKVNREGCPNIDSIRT